MTHSSSGSYQHGLTRLDKAGVRTTLYTNLNTPKSVQREWWGQPCVVDDPLTLPLQFYPFPCKALLVIPFANLFYCRDGYSVPIFRTFVYRWNFCSFRWIRGNDLVLLTFVRVRNCNDPYGQWLSLWESLADMAVVF